MNICIDKLRRFPSAEAPIVSSPTAGDSLVFTYISGRKERMLVLSTWGDGIVMLNIEDGTVEHESIKSFAQCKQYSKGKKLAATVTITSND